MSEGKSEEKEKEVDRDSFDEKAEYVPPAAEPLRPKDPRSKAKYNIFSRLLLW